MLVPGALKRGKLPFVEIFQVDAAHLGATRRAGRTNVDQIAAGAARNFTFDTHCHRLPAPLINSKDASMTRGAAPQEIGAGPIKSGMMR
jgi:hypothetical protein